jgi:hypothetical protein
MRDARFDGIDRFRMAFVRISENSRRALGLSVEEILEKCGYSSTDEFWADALSEQMDGRAFIGLLVDFQISQAGDLQESDNQSDGPLRMQLSHKLEQATRFPQPWIIRDPQAPKSAKSLEYWVVDARMAAQRYYDSPPYRSLLPKSLQSFLSPTTDPTTIKGKDTAPLPRNRLSKHATDDQRVAMRSSATELMPHMGRDAVIKKLGKEFGVARDEVRRIVPRSPRARGQRIVAKSAE